MKNLLKKLHMMPNQTPDIDPEGSTSSSSLKGAQKLGEVSSPNDGLSHDQNKPLSGLSGWLNSVTNRRSPSPSPPSSSNVKRGEGVAGGDSGSGDSRDPDVEEEYQIQMALELSAREDPEAVQIEAVKQISLGSCPPENTPAEVLAYRYWNYSALSYDDKILDGFYDLYGVLTGPKKMPSLVELQGTPVSDDVTWEAVLVNKAADAKLLRLEHLASEIMVKSRSESVGSVARRLAVLVSDHMGGPVGDPDKMLAAWNSFSGKLKATLGSMVLPLGSLKVGMARHRALLFKVLADSVGISCRLAKGKQYTGCTDVAINFIKIGDGREYIVDLMADPGTLIPSDTTLGSHEESFFSSNPWSRDGDSSRLTSTSSEEHSEFGAPEKRVWSRDLDSTEDESDDRIGQRRRSSGLTQPVEPDQTPKKSLPKEKRLSHFAHARSPSWTEGVSSPAVRKMKVKDVSQYMIDAAKENPQLAQKLHDVLLESGVVAPPNLFTEVYEEGDENDRRKATTEGQGHFGQLTRPRFVPRLPSGQKGPGGQPEHVEVDPARYARNVPAAAAAAAAAVVASSMVVAATRSATDAAVELPVAAAATATVAAVVATTTTAGLPSPGSPDVFNPLELPRRDGDGEAASGTSENDGSGEGERVSDKSSAGNESVKSEASLYDVADCEIAWEEITLGERIGLGSYGEVYRGDWHGTEVAVKKFLDQEVTLESLEEFKSEVGIMKRVRHPNVVLFMGAVTRAPHLSIVTEFLPRGSLYRLIHRPNNQLDARRRLRMAFDAARGMNYLHNCTPVIVHRDLKSPNLLVDKNWVVKVAKNVNRSENHF